MKRVLFVDDEPKILQGLKSMLYRRRKDWDMNFAEGGAAAVALIDTQRFDAVITDLRMPQVDGAAVLQRARACSPQAVRIVLSGQADAHLTMRVVAVAQQYLSKPCEAARLERVIDRCFATQDLIASEEIRSRLGTTDTLPLVPNIFTRLQAVLADEHADMGQIARVIELDPAIVAKLLQVVNSAFFRLPKRVSTIEQAVTYLGATTIRDLTLVAEVFKQSEALPEGIDPLELQNHALHVARLARMVSEGKPFADDAFLAGLVHEIGVLLLGKLFPAEMRRALDASRAGTSIHEAERTHVGIDHATAGAYLLGVWGVTFEVIEAVAHHHTLDFTHPEPLGVLSALAIAERLLQQIAPTSIPLLENTDVAPFDDAYLAAIGIKNTWPTLIKRAESLLEASK